MDNKQESYEWPPLESDPQIFNEYFWKIGLPINFEFDELWSLDYKEIQPIESSVLGIVCAIRRPKGKFYLEQNVMEYQKVPYYMKQEGSLDNACGLVASLHVFGNILEFLNLQEDSILGNFYTRSANANPQERCKLLEKDNKFKEMHYASAQQGQSSVPSTQEKVLYHYIAFVVHNNKLIELDGTLPGPILIKDNSSHESLLDDTIEELKKRIDSGVFAENLSIMLLKLKDVMN
jgi:ubiquitin carboxyl-terminal hydrolase L3